MPCEKNTLHESRNVNDSLLYDFAYSKVLLTILYKKKHKNLYEKILNYPELNYKGIKTTLQLTVKYFLQITLKKKYRKLLFKNVLKIIEIKKKHFKED